MLRLGCISWNVHRARGNDGLVDPNRTVDTLVNEVWKPGISVLCLQEADAEQFPFNGILDATRIEKATGLVSVHRHRHTRSHPTSLGFLGTAVFVAPEMEIGEVRLVDMAGVYPRGAVIVDANHQNVAFRLIATHLSLSQILRMTQLRTVAQHLSRFDQRPSILCGDLNEWRPWGGWAFSRAVLRETFRGSAPATFPVTRPILPLDRFLVNEQGQIETAEALDGPAIQATSDHRPLYAQITLEGPR
ncbi:MAG: endonuclease/exonuclease/phosphatase family protein [Pseudomonadota bacterium]